MLQTQPELVPAKIFAAIREYFCYKVYLVISYFIINVTLSLLYEILIFFLPKFKNAEVRFADWFHSFHKLEPMRPQKLSDDVQFTQKVTYEHQINQYNAEYEKWRSSVEEQTKV